MMNSKKQYVDYFNEHKHRIGVLLDWKQKYEDLKYCLNPDINEKAFMAAYEETFLEKK